MEMTFNRIDVPAATQAGNAPYDIVPRVASDREWLAAFSPVQFDSQIDWRNTVKGDYVNIPLFPYLAPNRPTDVIGYATQLGARILHDMQGRKVVRMHLSLGEPANYIEDASFDGPRLQFYLGVGIQLG